MAAWREAQEELAARSGPVIMRCAKPGCEDWRGDTIDQQREHIRDVHGIAREAMIDGTQARHLKRCQGCPKMFGRRGPNQRYCGPACPGRPGPVKKKGATSAFLASLLDALRAADGPVPTKDLVKEFDASAQRIANVLRFAQDDGRVKRGGRAGASTWTIAVPSESPA
jgi:hypothetical protein